MPSSNGPGCEEREVSLRDLQAAKKYGTIKTNHVRCRGKTSRRWKIEYGGVVYITDEHQKRVITTYKIRPPDPPPPIYTPLAPNPLLPASTLAPAGPWQPPILLTPLRIRPLMGGILTPIQEHPGVPASSWSPVNGRANG